MNKKKLVILRSEQFASSDDNEMAVSGYFAVFDQPTEIYPGENEVIKKGAFTESLKKEEVVALWNHDSQKVLGRTSNDTLDLEEDDHGLKGTLHIAPTSYGKDVYQLIKRGDLAGCSIGFFVDDYQDIAKDGAVTHEITKAQLLEVSVVTWPQYEQTEIAVRSKNDSANFYREAEKKKQKEIQIAKARRLQKLWENF